MTDVSVPPELPEGYLQSATGRGYPNNTGEVLRDPPYRAEVQRRDIAWREAERVVGYLQEKVVPIVQGRLL